MIDIDRFLAFIKERKYIHLRRKVGLDKPWTSDKILQSYRFCNAQRENDTVTKWIAENWRDPNKGDPDVWFAMVVARLVNWPKTLDKIGYPCPWARGKFMDAFRGEGKKFSSAYRISTNGVMTGCGGKQGYLADKVLSNLWLNIPSKEAFKSLAHFHSWLMMFNGLGSFLAGQVVCDTKYTDLLCDAPDWWTWSAPGPGSLRGLNRVVTGEVNGGLTVRHYSIYMMDLVPVVDKFFREEFSEGIHAQDVQNCLCEFDKYERVRLGEGFPRQKYEGV